MRRLTSRHRRWSALAVGLVLLAADANADDSASLNVLSGITVDEGARATEIIVTGSKAPEFTVFKLSDPVRLYVDIAGADVAGLKQPVIVDNGVVDTVTPLQFEDDVVRIARIVVGLETDAKYTVQARGKRLVIRVDAAKRKSRRPVVAVSAAGGEALKGALERARRAEARAREAEQTAAQVLADAAKASEAEARAQAAEARAAQAEARVAEIEARAARAANAIEEQAVESEASMAEAVHIADRRAVEAEAHAQAMSKRAEASARLAAKARREAQDASQRAKALERKVDQAQAVAADAEAAEKRARAAERRLAAVKKQAADAAASKARAREAEAQAAQARKRAEQAEARIARETRKAEQKVTEAQRKAARAAERAQAAEKALAAARASKASEAKVEAAQARAAEAEKKAKAAEAALTDARASQAELAQAQKRIDELEKALAAAGEEAKRAAEQASEAKKAAEQQVAAAKKASAQQIAAAEKKAGAQPTANPKVSAPAKAKSGPATRISNVEFEHDDAGSHVHVTFSGEPRYVVRKEGERTRVLEFEGALIDAAIERSLDTSDFASAVRLVSSFQAPPPGDRVRVVVTLSHDVKARVIERKQRLTWSFSGAGAGGTPRPMAATPPAPAWKGQATPRSTEIAYDRARAAVYTGMHQTISTDGGRRQRAERRKRYRGKKINIDIKDGDIHNVLRLLAKEGNVNIVTSDDVDGTVTLHLKLVPWDQALDIILRSKGLDMVREGDIIRIAPAEMLEAERARKLKEITVKEQLEPLKVKLVTVNHAVAGDLLARVRSVLSKRGTVEFDERTNTLIVKDVSDHVDAAEDIIRRLDTQTPQVLIEARIVEVNTVNALQLGIQWGGDLLFSSATGNPTGLRFPSTVGISGGADDPQAPNEGTATNPNFVVNLPAAAGAGSGGAVGFQFGSIDSTFNLNVRLSAFENRGTVKIVSSPKITTLDNKPAKISQGVSIPISQISAAGVQTVFFDAVLSIEATPHVTQDGNIYLKLKAENNTPDFQNVGARGDPTILKKEAETELLLKDGDTTVIGGIYTSNSGFNRSEIPYLARIPILGALFRNHQESDRRTELLIFVTPRIVNRSAAMVRTTQ